MRKKMLFVMILFIILPSTAYAMHIGEGFLPVKWAIFYYLLSAPFVYLGIRDIRKKASKDRDLKMLLALVGAYCFVLSALKLPSVGGSSSHPTGAGFGAIIFGPFVMAVIGTLVLLFQALFLAHGGITTLGANVFSMAIAGPFVSYAAYKILKKGSEKWAVFAGVFLGGLTTYAVTSLQLAMAFPAKEGGFLPSFFKFASIFALTQVPLAAAEGVLTVMIFNFIKKYSINELNILNKEA